jgi:hypothetical protein
MVDIDLDGVEFEEQKDLRPPELQSAAEEKSVIPDIIVKAGLVKNKSQANKLLVAVSISFFVVSAVLFAIASSLFVDSTSSRSTLVGDYLLSTSSPKK